MVYSGCIIQHTTHSNYSDATARDLVMDTAENLTQIGTWARDSFVKDQSRIELFLKLTRKNLNALLGFPLSAPFDSGFQKFTHSFGRLEKEYLTGITNHSVWAHRMLTWGTTLTQNAKLI